MAHKRFSGVNTIIVIHAIQLGYQPGGFYVQIRLCKPLPSGAHVIFAVPARTSRHSTAYCHVDFCS